MSHDQFYTKIEQAAHLAGAPNTIGEQLAQALLNRDPVLRVRLNPMVLAQELDVNPLTMLDLFIHGTRIGLFEWGWDLICPLCGFTSSPSAQCINDTQGEHFHCALCDISAPSIMDDTVEVSFSTNPALLAPLKDPHANLETYLSYYASQASPFTQEVSKMLEKQGLASARLEPGESAVFVFTPKHDKLYRVTCLDFHDSISFKGNTDTADPGLLNIEQNSDGFVKKNLPQLLPVTPVNIKMVNKSKATVFNQLFEVPSCHSDGSKDIQNVGSQEQISLFGPRVTGKILLNNQTFRDHYGIQKLDPNLSLKVRDLTMLFTDLKGSTELYDLTGDIEAYRLVRDHFLVLKEVVRQHSGAVVKTMGDAIMASFSTPQDGVRAALDMLTGLMAYSDTIRPHELGLKIGLHSGPALTVNAGDQLDFFGQTVNIAARVQGLAQAGEICLSESVNGGAGVKGILSEKHFASSREEVVLKGVSERNIIHRYVCRASNNS
ncbi:MAG: adenylate/guanylate cyclase domain-containing protein [Magnetococcales bacterium]|nr:adenylate/guanylate cyclase domain-containing protein [Magnetococcales bacterium]